MRPQKRALAALGPAWNRYRQAVERSMPGIFLRLQRFALSANSHLLLRIPGSRVSVRACMARSGGHGGAVTSWHHIFCCTLNSTSRVTGTKKPKRTRAISIRHVLRRITTARPVAGWTRDAYCKASPRWQGPGRFAVASSAAAPAASKKPGGN